MTTRSQTQAASYETAVRGLASPRTWCDAAKRLVAIGDRRALMPLLEAYEKPVEGGKRCLLEAMENLGATRAASGLFDGDPRQRTLALRLMELFDSDRHLPVLIRALSDPAAGVRAQARVAMIHQERTAAWKAAMAKLRDSDDPQIKAMAVDALDESKHRGQTNQS